VLINLIFAVALSSQPPSPSLRPVSSNEQSQAAGGTGGGQTDQRGTENSPLVVKLRTTKDSDKEAADEADYAKQEAADNRYLLVVTCILAVAALLQWAVMVWQACLLNRQTKTQVAEYKAANRPEITVQSVTARLMVNNSRETIGASVTCFNRGRVRAINVVVHGNIVRSRPMQDAHGPVIQTRSSVINRGMAHQFYIDSEYPLSDQAVLDSSAGQARLYCYGNIAYESEGVGYVGRTGFCYVWDSQKENWYSADIPELEYEF
jgi:hypothetical protein